MTPYALTSLLRLRERTKSIADTFLVQAIHQHVTEQEKLADIETCLRDTITIRTKMQHNFFLKAQQNACNKGEVACHISSRDKHLDFENTLRVTLKNQQEVVRCALNKIELAKSNVMAAERELKTIEKHHANWLHRGKRQLALKDDLRNDDHNTVKFIMNKV